MTAEASKAQPPLRVLFVDDEPMLLAAVSNVLHGHYEVRTATSGAEGMDLILSSEPFAVVVSDFAMPGMSGVEFLAQVRHASPDAMRVLLTGHATIEGAAAAVNEGFVFRFLVKPCSGRDLLHAINDAVEQYRLVTEDRQLLERKLEAMSGHLVRAERLASLGTMSAAVGHEVNNVLAAFAGALAFIEEDAQNGNPQDPENLRVLRQVQDQLTLLARNLLQFGKPARLDEPGHTDIKESINEVLGLMRLSGRFRNIQVRLNVPAEPVVINMGRATVQQVLLNVIKNAVEALDTTPQPRIDIVVTLDPSTTTAECVVRDNGPGISPNSLPLLFEPYFTTKPADVGTGLGLFVVRDTLRKAGGDVIADSVFGRGAAFTLTLPLRADSSDVRPSLARGSAA